VKPSCGSDVGLCLVSRRLSRLISLARHYDFIIPNSFSLFKFKSTHLIFESGEI